MSVCQRFRGLVFVLESPDYVLSDNLFCSSRYNKTEDLTPGGPEMNHFTHLLIGVASGSGERELEPYRLTHTVVTAVNGFTRLKITPTAFPFVEILTDPKIYLLKRNNV